MKALLINSPYNPLSEQEINHYFKLVDMSKIDEQSAKDLKQRIVEMAEKEPYVRRLIRDKIQNNEKIFITNTQEDRDYIQKSNVGGVSFEGEKRVSFNQNQVDSSWFTGLVYHELLHTDQSRKNLWLKNETKEMTHIANKLNEAEAISLNYLITKDYSPYFEKLRMDNENRLRQHLQDEDIPYENGLTNEERQQAKELYIRSIAAEQTIGQNIHILMQPSGIETVQTATKYGLVLTSQDLENLDYWRSDYNRVGLLSAQNLHSESDVGMSHSQEDERRRVIKYFEERYPSLQGQDFFKTGLTQVDIVQNDILSEVTSLKVAKHANGKTAYQISLNEAGLPDGEEIYYDSAGQIIQKNRYKNGNRDGLSEYYELDEQGKTYLSKQIVFREGKEERAVSYNPKGTVVSQIKYLPESESRSKTYDYVDYDEQGNIIESGRRRDGKNIGHQIFLVGDERSDIEWNDKGVFISANTVNRVTGRLVSTSEYVKENSEVYKTTKYDQSGHIQSVGYRTQSEGNAPIGKWLVCQTDNSYKTVWYNGEVGESSSKGEPNGQKIASPFERIEKEGYIQDKNDLNCYMRVGQNGLTDRIFLDPITNLIICEGQTNQEGKAVGIWRDYYPTGVISSVREMGKPDSIQSITYYNKEGNPKSKVKIHTDGTETEIVYWEDKAGTIKSQYHYEPESNSTPEQIISFKEYYVNGQEKIRSNAIVQIEKTIEGKNVSESLQIPKNILNASRCYYTDKPNQVRSENISLIGFTITNKYRKDGTLMSRTVCDKNNQGEQTFFTPSGEVRARGSVKEGKKDGNWTYFSTGKEKRCQYHNGVRIPENTDNSTKQNKNEINRLNQMGKKNNSADKLSLLSIMRKNGHVVNTEENSLIKENYLIRSERIV